MNQIMNQIMNQRVNQRVMEVIICTKDRRNELQRCLTSLYSQTDKDFSIIIIDQSSSQHAYLKNPHVDVRRYVMNDKGLSKARNFGLRVSKAEMVAFIDDDGIAEKEWIVQMKKSLQQYDFVGGRIESLSGGSYVTMHEDKHFLFDSFWSLWRFAGGNFALRKRVLKKVGLFDERLGAGAHFGSADETDFVFRLWTKHFRGAYNPKMIIHHPPIDTFSAQKIFSYAKGTGAFFRKIIPEHPLYLYYLLNIFTKRTLRLMQYSCFNKKKALAQYSYLKGLLHGFIYFVRKS